MVKNLGEIIIHAGIIQGIFASILLWKRENKASQALIPLVICFSLVVSHNYYVRDFAAKFFTNPYVISEPFIFLIAPFLYFYFEHIGNSKFKLRWTHIAHLLPFFMFFASFIPINLHGKGTLYYHFLYENPIIITAMLWILLSIQFVYYWQKIRQINKAYINQLQQEQSAYLQYDATWVRTFSILFFLVFVLVATVLTVFIHTSNFENFNQIIPIFFSIAVFFITYKGLNQKTPETNSDTKTEETNTESNAPNPFADRDLDALKRELSELMERKKPFLNPELTLIELAELMGITRNQLSYLINNVLNSNFYLYVNEFRINYLKDLMKKDPKKQFTILALAFDSGFNSKSSFNAIFKKVTGLTPSEYRNSI